MTSSSKDGKGQPPPAWYAALARAVEWPGVFGWVGTGFAVAGLWCVASAFALRSRAARMEEPGPEATGGAAADARAAAEGARRLGFGERFLRPVLVHNEAGVIARDGTAAGAKTVAVVFGMVGSVGMISRPVEGGHAGRAVFGRKAGKPLPRWVRLVRRGDVFEGFASGDGVSWSPVSKQRLRMKPTVLLGLVANSRSGEPCRARIRSLRITPEPEGDWQGADVGEVRHAGSSSVSGPTAMVEAAGFGMEGKAESLHFAYRRATGDFEIVAHVKSIEPELVLPDPLQGVDLTRARMGVRANARASGVFGVFALLVSVFLWGFRRFDPVARSAR